MSITIRAEATSDDRGGRRARYEAVLRSVCPGCGGRPHHTGEEPRADIGCDVCLGYGGDPEAERAMEEGDAREDGPTLNISTDNGRALLRVLGLGTEEIESGCGGWDTTTLATRIAMAEAVPMTIAAEVRAPERFTAIVLTADGVDEVERGWDPGLPADRITERYLPALRNIVTYAAERGVGVIWD